MEVKGYQWLSELSDKQPKAVFSYCFHY